MPGLYTTDFTLPCILLAGLANKNVTATSTAAAIAAAAPRTADKSGMKDLKGLARRAPKMLLGEAPWTNWVVIVLSMVLEVDEGERIWTWEQLGSPPDNNAMHASQCMSVLLWADCHCLYVLFLLC